MQNSLAIRFRPLLQLGVLPCFHATVGIDEQMVVMSHAVDRNPFVGVGGDADAIG